MPHFCPEILRSQVALLSGTLTKHTCSAGKGCSPRASPHTVGDQAPHLGPSPLVWVPRCLVPGRVASGSSVGPAGCLTAKTLHGTWAFLRLHLICFVTCFGMACGTAANSAAARSLPWCPRDSLSRHLPTVPALCSDVAIPAFPLSSPLLLLLLSVDLFLPCCH